MSVVLNDELVRHKSGLKLLKLASYLSFYLWWWFFITSDWMIDPHTSERWLGRGSAR